MDLLPVLVRSLRTALSTAAARRLALSAAGAVFWVGFLGAVCWSGRPGWAGGPKNSHALACVSVEAAAQESGRDVCVSVHIYDVVELTDGTRFLDVCPPDVPDDGCRFTIVSLGADRQDVGDLGRYRNQDVQVRGIVRSTHGRLGIALSDMRQFRGGPEKFRPNPKLLHGFSGESDRPPVRDPNLAASGRRRAFMNSRDREALPAARKP